MLSHQRRKKTEFSLILKKPLNIIKTILCDETMHNIMKILKSAKKDPNNLSQKLFEILLLSIQDHLDKVMTYH